MVYSWDPLPPRNIFHATAVYRDACKRNKVQVLETLPLDWCAAGHSEVTWELETELFVEGLEVAQSS